MNGVSKEINGASDTTVEAEINEASDTTNIRHFKNNPLFETLEAEEIF